MTGTSGLPVAIFSWELKAWDVMESDLPKENSICRLA